jgi:hypothetical protein
MNQHASTPENITAHETTSPLEIDIGGEEL